MKYRYLNEVLLDWNSDKDFQDNNIIKSNDIKKKIDQCFIYRVDDKPSKIKIFDLRWPEFEKFKDKVYINGKHVELTDIEGYTVNIFDPGEYRVYIEDIDQMINCIHGMFYDCQQLIKAYIPNTVTSISSYAFYNCINLASVTIPSSVTYIDGYAFNNCTRLSSMIISNFVISIGSCAFQNCTSLTNMTIPDSVTSICSYAFNGCIGLTSVTIGNSVTAIGDYAFNNCKNIQTVYVEDINKFKQIDFGFGFSNPTDYGAKLIELQNYEI